MDETKHEAAYLKGFNEGYVITRHLPELAGKLATVQSEAPRVDGFKDGRRQHILEQLKDNREKWKAEQKSHPDRAPSRSKDKGMDRD